MPAKRRIRLPLQVVAAFSVIGLLAVVVSLLSWQAYRGTQEVLISASNDAIGYISEAIAEKARRNIEPAEEQLAALVHSSFGEADTLEQRLAPLPLVSDLLSRSTLIDALFVGYPNGEFILFRPLRNETERRRFSITGDATILAQSITDDGTGQMIGEYRLYDRQNRLLKTESRPEYVFDPRMRPWYQEAATQDGVITTPPYVFFTNEAIGMTLARRSLTGGAVLGLDIKLISIATELSRMRITPSTELALVDQQGQVVAYRDMLQMIIRPAHSEIRLARIDELNVPALQQANKLSLRDNQKSRATVVSNGRTWQIIKSPLEVRPGRTLSLLIGIPDDEFFAAARHVVWRQTIIAGVLILLAIPAAWFITKRMVKPLRILARETMKIESFDFSSDIKIRSHIGEIDDLGRSLDRMKRTIRKFLKIGTALAAEPKFKPLLDRVLQEAVDLVRSDGGAIYMISEDRQMLIPEVIRWHDRELFSAEQLSQPLPLDGPAICINLAEALETKDIRTVERPLNEDELTALGLHGFVHRLQALRVLLIIVPLLDRNQAPLGALMLIKAISHENEQFDAGERLLKLVHAVSGSASVAIQNKLLLEAQRKLIDALIKLVAGAIDAKSAYTGGHCQRVPVLTRLLAEAACGAKTGPYRDFNLSEEEWEALDIAAWLHDCGKVTTPEYVVDKATKLETIYDRIHEIRNRFEILKRDAEIDYWRGVAEGGDPVELRSKMTSAQRQLDDDFAFVAHCNEGGEFMEPTKIERIKRIAKRTWRRTISNRLGVSYEEKARMDRVAEPMLPVDEPLLADRDDHLIYHSERDLIGKTNPWGFQLNEPTYKYNRGEVYNLCISRGTLTAEERYRINDHIVQTIVMLESLPFPAHLKSVPELAGGHHEKMDGKGYPSGCAARRCHPSPA
ncbi:HD domain-containing phosphohydrolase [Dongia soli]|uniref:HD domain-containing phosphohydrolase n=1 Tax=Dongia soli TaxID=600628 RepID=A0ABU5ECR6_9PROT|nr:HD domain-containing phosphohydrolase [Dongia soli]MDY0883340.1 HD domain-containing phosphohydrolase [Dongia soli]